VANVLIPRLAVLNVPGQIEIYSTNANAKTNSSMTTKEPIVRAAMSHVTSAAIWLSA
jgi:hypothetical protein